MRLSEAIELGSTLIGETREAYYYTISCKGCALGAAWVAMGKMGCNYDEGDLASAFPIYNHNLSAHEAEIMGWHSNRRLGPTISVLHSVYEVPRLEIARRIRLIEDLHPEIPGYELQVVSKNVASSVDDKGFAEIHALPEHERLAVFAAIVEEKRIELAEPGSTPTPA